METQKIWNNFSDEIYFFILKKVRNKQAANDVFQNSFFKIHKNLEQVKTPESIKAWVFQIVRNEITNYFSQESKYVEQRHNRNPGIPENYEYICCFDRFIDDLPEHYKEVIKLVYIRGIKQTDTAKQLDLSLANVKARIRRAKTILKRNFKECCHYEWDEDGKLIGEPNCSKCEPSHF